MGVFEFWERMENDGNTWNDSFIVFVVVICNLHSRQFK